MHKGEYASRPLVMRTLRQDSSRNISCDSEAPLQLRPRVFQQRLPDTGDFLKTVVKLPDIYSTHKPTSSLICFTAVSRSLAHFWTVLALLAISAKRVHPVR